MKSQQQRIEDAAAVLRQQINPCNHEALARKVLEAADRESPKWPTDEVYNRAHNRLLGSPVDDDRRERLRRALLADPIIRAAIAYRDENRKRRETNLNLMDWPEGQALADAVNEAGL